MKLLGSAVLLISASYICASAQAQAPEKVKAEDERYKADILIVVAHPDDEAFFTPYAAKAIYDMHKRVAVIFSTHGGSGVNRYSRERGPAMAEEREIEARQACAKLGITNVWFLDGKDTPSQDVLDSLSNWGHGANLEKMVGLIRLARPEVIFTQFPGVFIGENHGDHQATGVLVTEAFDLSADPAVFPSQLAGPVSHYESYLSNLQTWQPKKIYFASDANNQDQFNGAGPTYSVREVSPSQKKPYWRLAIESAMEHRTQFPEEIDRLSKMSDTELEQMMSNPNTAWWSEPSTLIFGKSVVGGKPTDDVFANIDAKPQTEYSEAQVSCGDGGEAAVSEKEPRFELGGPWRFYAAFYPAHGLCQLPAAKVPELGITVGATLVIPLVIRHDPGAKLTINLNVNLPDRWKVTDGAGPFVLPAESSTFVAVQIDTPKLPADELKKIAPQEVRVSAEADGKSLGEIRVRALLKTHALPEDR
jgi:LmbE family N-acetylglucosaminyl deacetylase